MRTSIRLAALGTALTVVVGLASAPATAAPKNDSLNAAFASAAAEFDVPRDLVVAVGYGETHLDGHGGQPSQDNGFGVMHLVSNPTRHTLEDAATLTGESADTLRTDTPANVRGGAAVLRAMADELGLSNDERNRMAAWYPVVARYGGAKDDAVARLYADTVYDLLAGGMQVRTPSGERVEVRPYQGKPERGALEKAGGVGTQGLDYPNSRWIAANPSNYSPGRSAAINLIVIHVTQGSYAGTVSWFQNPAAQVSAHYVVRSSDGEITQMVRDGDTAYHVRSANSRALGIEHEGFVDNPSWFTDSMYRSSAALTKWLCERHGLPKTRQFIQGHNEIPGNDHTDPGPHWNWDYYMGLVNSGGGGAGVYTGSPADFNGDGRDDVVTFNQGTAGDVYVATSNGSAFVGSSVKWHEFFSPAGETPLTGDFNGDGKDDIVTFTHGSLNDVYVALSNGSSFGPGVKWHDFFGLAGEVPSVGDVNGDGLDDIVTFTRGSLNDVYVALSTGTSFAASAKWQEFFGLNGETPGVGDVNGDGKADIVVFSQGTLADVYVALSTGSSFGGSAKWHDFFSTAGESPRIGDFNGDGKTDIATFTNNAAADVYVATSTGSAFVGTTVKWNDFFGLAGEFPYTGDFNGDGKDDAVVFTKGSLNDVYAALSNGTGFLGGAKWHDFFGLDGEITL